MRRDVKRTIGILGFAALLLLAFSCSTNAETPQAQPNSTIREVKLPNGLLVILKEVHAAPVVCTYIWYRVGSRDEKPGITGISHQIEHMMFKGTRKLFPKPGYIDLIVGRHGGENNAETDTDHTAYYFLLPSNQLDLALRIEADRMTQAAMDPKQLIAEKRVVLSELEGDENDNAYFLSESARATAFQYHPYHYPVIGTKWDVLHFTPQSVSHYYHTYYAPNNASLVVVGDFDSVHTIKRIQDLWKDVKPTVIPHTTIDPEPPQLGERRVIVQRAGATPYVQFEYHIPALMHPDLPALEVLGTALSSGRSSILYRALVESELATSVSAGPNMGIDPELFDVAVSVRSGVSPMAAEAALLSELERVSNAELSSHDLQKAKNQTKAQIVFQQDSIVSQAYRIGFYQTITGNWRNMDREARRIETVSAADVMRVAKKYFRAENRTVATFVPNSEAQHVQVDVGGPHSVRYNGAKRLPRFPGGTVNSAQIATERKTEDTATQPKALVIPKKFTLPNGMTLVVREDHSKSFIKIGGFIRLGAVNDPTGKFGLCNVLAEMLTRGTESRSSQQIAESEDYVGAGIAISAEQERMGIDAWFLRRDFKEMLGLLADILRNPAFPADELEKVKADVLSALAEMEHDTGSMALSRLYEGFFGRQNPYGHLPLGIAADVGTIATQDVQDFYRTGVRPENTTLVVVGDVTPEEAKIEVAAAFGGWKSDSSMSGPLLPKEEFHGTSGANTLLVIPDKSQDDIVMGSVGLSRRAPDFEAAVTMNQILGADEFVGRIGKRIRDTDGLAYYAFTQFVATLNPGPFLFRAGVNPKNVNTAIREAHEEIDKMRRLGASKEELDWAKDHLVGARAITYSTTDGVLGRLEDEEFFGLGLDYDARYPDLIRALTVQDIDAAAQKYLAVKVDTVVAGPSVPGFNAK